MKPGIGTKHEMDEESVGDSADEPLIMGEK